MNNLPLQTLIEWFPDKKGLASGLTIMGFGSGALLFAPAANVLLEKFRSVHVIRFVFLSKLQTNTDIRELFVHNLVT